jgi:hypothetical protein
VKITDTYHEIIILLNKMNGLFVMDLWEEYASRISNELPEKLKQDSREYDFDNDVIPVIHHTMNNVKQLEAVHNSFLKATDGLSERIKSICGYELHVDIIFYLGLCNGAGWATKLDGKPAVLLGVEKIIELDWCGYESMASLIYHEIGHIWHNAAGGTRENDRLTQLYREGIAMYFEQLITGDFSHYRQDKNGWLDWCELNKSALKTEYLRRINADESTQDFFGDWNNYQGYSDVGYYIGCEFIKWLSERHSLDAIAVLDGNAVYIEFQNYTSENNN